MSTDGQPGKMPPQQTHRLSLEKPLALRGQAFGRIKFHAGQLAILGNALEALDAALQTIQTDNSASEQQALVAASRSLSILLGGE